MEPQTRDALVAALADHDALVEVGIGNRPAVAAGLADDGCTVTATDVVEREVPPGVAFVRDDVTDPDPSVYALNCPPELQRALREAASRAGAACYFTTLGADPATVPVERRTLPGETLFVARERGE